ncbi:MAG: hypothetical protein ACXQS1_04875 [Methermicoccaceae archaeon]
MRQGKRKPSLKEEEEMIINLTQHSPTPEQVAQGVVDLEGEAREQLIKLLTFNELPTPDEVRERAEKIAALAARYSRVAMVGGAPYLMPPLERALRERGIKPLYAFSRREVREEKLDDGTVKKVAVFRHLGFVEGCL